jgi:hypothetical protein
MKNLLLVLPCAALLCGCQANYYADKYRNEMTAGSEGHLLPHTGAAEIVPVPMTDLVGETARYVRKGYEVIGYSKFSADTDDYSAPLRAEAEVVKADIVLSSSYAKGYRTEVGPMDRGNPTLGNNSSNSGGYIVSGGSRPPATGTPQANPADNMAAGQNSSDVGVSEYRAVFMRRRAVIMGANLEALSGAEAMLSHVTHGLRVSSVVNGSPAMHAGILADDIVESVDGQPLSDVDGYRQLVDSRAGTAVRVTLVRNGEEITVPVQLNSLPKAP